VARSTNRSTPFNDDHADCARGQARALLAVAIASTVKDPDILNNVTLIPIRVS
jgi:hypothetical protein